MQGCGLVLGVGGCTRGFSCGGNPDGLIVHELDMCSSIETASVHTEGGSDIHESSGADADHRPESIFVTFIFIDINIIQIQTHHLQNL